jgi:F-box-like
MTISSRLRWRLHPDLIHQTYLGASSQQTLTLHGRRRRGEQPGGEPLQEAFIFRLPDELLLAIFEDASVTWILSEEKCECQARYHRSTLSALACVNQQIHHLVIPLLYRTLGVEEELDLVPPSKRMRAIWSSLNNKPSLRQHCRVLCVVLNDMRGTKAGLQDYSIASDLAAELKHVRCLKIHGGFEEVHNESMWTFVRSAVQNMQGIQHLSLSRQCWGLYLKPIIENVHLPKLRKLYLHGISGTQDARAVILGSKVCFCRCLWLQNSRHGPKSLLFKLSPKLEPAEDANSRILESSVCILHFPIDQRL